MLCVPFVSQAADLAPDMPRIRAVDPWIDELLAAGYAASPTFRELMNRLQRSDVIVHIEPGMVRTRAAGMLRFVISASGVRYLRITIAMPSASPAAIALLGHELQHAAEVADDGAVLDGASFDALYRRIGDGCRKSPGRYDTRAAREAGRRILSELCGKRHRPS